MGLYPWHRILATDSLGLSSCVGTAGCIGEDSGWVGVDKNLVVENQMTSRVHLHLVVEP